MASDKKEYEDKMEEMRKGIETKIPISYSILTYSLLELRDSRNEHDAAEKRLETAQDEQQKCLNEFKEKEEALEMEIFKLKTELDTSQVSNISLKETITVKEDDIRLLHDRILDVSLLSSFLFMLKYFV